MRKGNTTLKEEYFFSGYPVYQSKAVLSYSFKTVHRRVLTYYYSICRNLYFLQVFFSDNSSRIQTSLCMTSSLLTKYTRDTSTGIFYLVYWNVYYKNEKIWNLYLCQLQLILSKFFLNFENLKNLKFFFILICIFNFEKVLKYWKFEVFFRFKEKKSLAMLKLAFPK